MLDNTSILATHTSPMDRSSCEGCLGESNQVGNAGCGTGPTAPSYSEGVLVQFSP